MGAILSEASEFYKYQRITPSELNTLALELPFPDLLTQLNPLINKYAAWHVPGIDREELEQEIKLVLWKVQNVYSPEKGSFLNIAIFSIKNRLGQMRAMSKKQVQPITRLSCEKCGHTIVTQLRAKCPQCGGRRWVDERDEHAIFSIQARQETNPSFDIREPGESTGSVDVDILLDTLQNEDLWMAERALSGYKLTKKQRNRLSEIYFGEQIGA